MRNINRRINTVEKQLSLGQHEKRFRLRPPLSGEKVVGGSFTLPDRHNPFIFPLTNDLQGIQLNLEI